MNKKYLCIDAEFTSLGKENNLITLYLGIFDDFKLIDELNLKLMPNDGIFQVDCESMRVNNIDLRNWDGIKYKDAKSLVDDFIRKYVYDKNRVRIADNLIPLGQGVKGDINKIQQFLITPERWDEAVERIPIDTLYIAQFLRDIGKLKSTSISLEALSTHFDLYKDVFKDYIFGKDIVDDGETFHSARFDALLTYALYLRLVKL